jgi:hypothetical protein
LREKHRLRAFENRVPRKIFGPKRDEVTGKWKRYWNGKGQQTRPQTYNGTYFEAGCRKETPGLRPALFVAQNRLLFWLILIAQSASC